MVVIIIRFLKKTMDGIECYHPIFKNINDYSNMIISQDNIKNNTVPDKCPLKKDCLVVVYTL
jgi:hypothetical protein